jgi:hypothetical protein
MAEKWVAVFRPMHENSSRFRWVRDRCGSIMVFDSRREAAQWVVHNTIHEETGDEVLYIRYSRPDA